MTRNQTIKTQSISVQDGLRVKILSSNTLLRNPSQNNLLEASLITGNGILVNQSSYIGNWYGYTCNWEINDGLTFTSLGNTSILPYR